MRIESRFDRPAQQMPWCRALSDRRDRSWLQSSAKGVSQNKRARCWAILVGDFQAESGISEIKLLSQVLQDVRIALLHRGNRAARKPRVDSMNDPRTPGTYSKD
jgi:hypothetical protein